MMTDDAVLEASAGPDVEGTVYRGKAAIARARRAVFKEFDDARWNNPIHFLAGDRAVSEWVFSGTRRDGSTVEVQGCDILTLRDGKVEVNSACWKQIRRPFLVTNAANRIRPMILRE